MYVDSVDALIAAVSNSSNVSSGIERIVIAPGTYSLTTNMCANVYVSYIWQANTIRDGSALCISRAPTVPLVIEAEVSIAVALTLANTICPNSLLWCSTDSVRATTCSQVPGSVVLDAAASNSDRRRVFLITRGVIELIGLNITGGFCREGAGLYMAAEQAPPDTVDKPVVTMTELNIYGNA